MIIKDKKMILDVRIDDHYKYELFDANGNRLDYVVRADTETGRITRVLWGDMGKPRVNEYGEWLFEEINVPAPLKVIKHE